jgi:hypothetical protein
VLASIVLQKKVFPTKIVVAGSIFVLKRGQNPKSIFISPDRALTPFAAMDVKQNAA